MGGSGRSPRRRTTLTGRAAILAVVVCALAMTLAYPFRQFLSQRAEIAELREQTAAQEQQVSELERLKERWKDDDFVAAQARERLHYVRPGEKPYIVLSPEEAPVVRADAAGSDAQRPWYARLWDSVEAADAGRPAPAGGAPAAPAAPPAPPAPAAR